MPKRIALFRTRVNQFFWLGGFPVIALALLLGSLATSPAQALSTKPTGFNKVPAPILQGTITSTSTFQRDAIPPPIEPTTVYSFSLTSLGYDEVALKSPLARTEYTFRIPENWLIQSDGLFELDLSYTYDQIDAQNVPTQFGALTVKLDDQTLEIFPIVERELNHYRLSVPLPLSLLTSAESQHVIGVGFDAGLLCRLPHQATLVVHPTSSVFLNYDRRPLELDLSRYPEPFFQQGFTSDILRFVLPAKSTSNDATIAVGVAGKLGDLTNRRQVISATTDTDFRRSLATDPVIDEHLLVIGQPQHNQLLPLLNAETELPVSLHQRQLELITQGPTEVGPGDAFTYVFTVTNVIDRAVNLSLVNPLPAYSELLSCTPNCLKGSDHTITWSIDSLGMNKTATFLLTLKAADTLSGTIENTVTLVEAGLGPINAGTLTSNVVTNASASEKQVSQKSNQDGYFFVYNDLAVAEGDGIIQELPSPWHEDRAILIITGLSDKAVQKAGQAMSSESRFPGMHGPVALVQDVLSPSELSQTTPVTVENTLADLGYSEKVLRGQSSPAEYYFKVPYGWQLIEPAAIDLYFNHSQLIDYEKSGLTVLLNRRPIASIALNDQTATAGHLQISLVDANIQTGEFNRLTVQAEMSLPEECAELRSDRIWLVIKDTSKIFLAHNEVGGPDFTLDYFPYPFHTSPALTNLLFALPNAPNVTEWEAVLRIAASVGNLAGQKTVLPVAMLGDDLPEQDLANYQIIAIGRPSRNTLIQRANPKLPQPFLPGSDKIEQRLDDVVFRLPPSIDLGYLQLIPSPWNERHAFLAVTGTTEQGVAQSADVLTNKRWLLKGDLILVEAGKVNSIDTRPLTSGGVVAAVATVIPAMAVATLDSATATPAPSATPTTSPASSTSKAPIPEQVTVKTDPPAWLIPLVGLNGLLVVGIFAFAFWRTRQRKLQS